MGSNQCEAFDMPLQKKSAAYGQYECVVQNDREYAIVTKSIERSIVDYEQLKQQLQKRKKIKSINLINLCSYELSHQHGIVELKLQYQYIPLTLQEKREIWRTQNKQLTESELCNILIGVQRAIIELHGLGIGHRCINLDTILCFHTLYKLTDISMITFLTGYDLARQGDPNQFLSPQLLNYLQYQGTDPHYSLADDFFSLAMVIIALLYMSSKDEATQVNMKRVEQGLKIAEKSFTDWIGIKLREMIYNCLGESFLLGKKSSNQKTKGSS